MTATFIALTYSPWSEKARWALDHHRIGYVEKAYTPMLGEAALRWRLRRARGAVSVPVLLDGGDVLTDSFDIAQHAERRGTGAPLFRRGEEAQIAHWNQVSDRAMRAGRALATHRLASDPLARQESLPSFVPRALRRPLAPAAVVGVRFLQRKYAVGEDEVTDRAELRAALELVREALLDGRTYLVGGRLSYADVAIAAALQFVEPVDTETVQFGPATRRSWTDLELAGELTDLLEWRDQLYRRHRS